MKWRFAKAVVEDIAEIGDMIHDTLVNFGRELAEVGEDPVSTRQGIVAACSVMLATFLAVVSPTAGGPLPGSSRSRLARTNQRRLTSSTRKHRTAAFRCHFSAHRALAYWSVAFPRYTLSPQA
jgi:hypothetical protein